MPITSGPDGTWRRKNNGVACRYGTSLYAALAHVRNVLALSLCTLRPASATGFFTVEVAGSSVPIEITNCAVQSFDGRDFLLQPTVSFRNDNASSAVAVQVQLDFFSHGFDGDTSEGPPLTFFFEGDFAKGVDIANKTEALHQVRYPSNAFVKCSIRAARFADGTTLHADDLVHGSSLQSSVTQIAATDVANLPCGLTNLTSVAAYINQEWRAKDVPVVDLTSAALLSKVLACEVGLSPRELASTKLMESIAHSWRGLALWQEGKYNEAITELSSAIDIEEPILADANLDPTQLPLSQTNVDALINKRAEWLRLFRNK